MSSVGIMGRGVSGREALLVTREADEFDIDVHEVIDAELAVPNEQLLASRDSSVLRGENNDSALTFRISLLFASRNDSISLLRRLTSPNRFGHSSVELS